MTVAMDADADIDKGYAWVVLGACFVLRILTEGFWCSLGIFLVEWQTYFDASASDVAIIGSMALVVILTAAPFSTALSAQLTSRAVGIVGGVMLSFFMFATSFATQLWHIYLTVALAGIGLGLAYQIGCTFFFFYFDKRLGFANGICCGGAAIGMLSMAPLFQALMEGYGWRGGTLIISAILANVCTFAALLRSPSSMLKKDFETIKTPNGMINQFTTNKNRTIWREFAKNLNFSLWGNVRFILVALTGFVSGIGYTSFVIYVVPYADDVGIAKMKSSLLISIMGISSLAGRLSHGFLIDKDIVLPSHLSSVSWAFAALAVLGFPFTEMYTVLASLIAAFGFFSGIGISLMFIMMKNAVGAQKAAGGFAWCSVLAGPGSLIGIYLCGYWYDLTSTFKPAFLMAGTGLLCLSMLALADYFVERWQLQKKQQLDYIQTTKGNDALYVALDAGETSQNKLEIVVTKQNDQFHKFGTEV